jgi:hypothetical protein
LEKEKYYMSKIARSTYIYIIDLVIFRKNIDSI